MNEYITHTICVYGVVIVVVILWQYIGSRSTTYQLVQQLKIITIIKCKCRCRQRGVIVNFFVAVVVLVTVAVLCCSADAADADDANKDDDSDALAPTIGAAMTAALFVVCFGRHNVNEVVEFVNNCVLVVVVVMFKGGFVQRVNARVDNAVIKFGSRTYVAATTADSCDTFLLNAKN